LVRKQRLPALLGVIDRDQPAASANGSSTIMLVHKLNGAAGAGPRPQSCDRRSQGGFFRDRALINVKAGLTSSIHREFSPGVFILRQRAIRS